MLFALPMAIAVPIVAGILLGGPLLGFVVAAVIALVIVAVALRLGTQGDTTARETSWRRAAARRSLVPLTLAVAGIVVGVLGSGTVDVIGWGVLAVAITLAISLVFLEVGYSEDRARARGNEDPMRRPDRR
jgi:hypothetical protein